MKRIIATVLMLLLLCSCAAIDNFVAESDNVSAKPTASAVEKKSTKSPAKEQTKEPVKTTEPSLAPLEALTDEEIPVLYTDPDKFKGRAVTITGKVFTDPEYGEDGVYFQMWQDSKNSNNNTMIKCEDKSIKLKDGDYVELTGIILGNFDGENAFGGSMNAAMIQCSSLKVVSYAEVVAPAIKTKKINKSIKQYKYEVILEKVEFAKSETRLYITVNNNGKESFSLYDFNSKITQGKKQYDSSMNYEADYPQVQTDLLPGASTSGIMCFPEMDPDKALKVYLDGSSGDYSQRIKQFVYNVK